MQKMFYVFWLEASSVPQKKSRSDMTNTLKYIKWQRNTQNHSL